MRAREPLAACTVLAVLALLAVPGPAQSLLDGRTVATTHFHGAQPSQTTIFGPVNSVVGPGVELVDFGATYFVLGQPMQGFVDVDFSDTNVLITATVNQPFSYFTVLRFADALGTIPSFTAVTINPATNWSGFNASDIFVAADYFQINLTALNGQLGQQISLDVAGDVPYCQPDLGSGGPGNALFTLCGDPLAAGMSATAVLSGAAPNAPAVLAVSGSTLYAPIAGGIVVPDVAAGFLLPFTIDPSGTVTLADVPGGGGPLTLYSQWAILDPAQPQGLAFSNALQVEILP